ncbi:uncharacterized protein BP5553_07130 [Venustampulla echinocandica]|uniref:Rhodopsin domain-containing protein n=1 Tax=Venustampulla echinocandica TaxID=2656787 RepID=A0A370TIL0_9HELO|nr:uncharacterized protein BP5553_07130 [Venustampulla echinocandica]RDL35199.1 hypothetical protein BP5553_07130 [Venustampulla echinocandica]
MVEQTEVWHGRFVSHTGSGILEGRKATSLMDPHLGTYMKYVYICGEFYFPIVLATNISILMFYRRIFSVGVTFNRLSLALIALQILWFIPGFFGETFMCTPTDTLWNNPLEIPEKCIYYSTYFVVIMGFELLIDLMILALPVVEIMKLKLSWEKKLMLSFVFLLGGFVIATGIVRIIVCYEPGQQSVDLAVDMIWLDIHTGTAIICACLPSFRHLYTKSASIVSSSLRKYYGSATGSGSGFSSKGTASNSHGGRLELVPPHISSTSRDYKNFTQFSGDEVHLVGIKATSLKERDQVSDHERHPSNGIRVQRTVDIV